MPSMQILLTGWGVGMEYYGATRTGIGSLKHVSRQVRFTVAAPKYMWTRVPLRHRWRTYRGRDELRHTWIDESVVVWCVDRVLVDFLADR